VAGGSRSRSRSRSGEWNVFRGEIGDEEQSSTKGQREKRIDRTIEPWNHAALRNW